PEPRGVEKFSMGIAVVAPHLVMIVQVTRQEGGGSNQRRHHAIAMGLHVAALDEDETSGQQNGTGAVQTGVEGREIGKGHGSLSSFLMVATNCCFDSGHSTISPCVWKEPRNRPRLSTITKMVLCTNKSAGSVRSSGFLATAVSFKLSMAR